MGSTLKPPSHRVALTRRQWLQGAGCLMGALTAAGFGNEPIHAMARRPVGGTLRLHLPWATHRVDPHDLFDPMAAILGTALAEPVYAADGRGNFYPTLADGMPFEQDGETVVRLRPGLVSARGKALSGRDLAWSITRARRSGAVGVLAKLAPYAKSDKEQPLLVKFGKSKPQDVAAGLSSPLVSLVPVGFNAWRPDGTGAFLVKCYQKKIVLTRNLNAPRGASFLDGITITFGKDLTTSLRSFETGRDNVGWQGAGLHRPRAGAVNFDVGDCGWVVLASGNKTGRFGAPGVAQHLANGVPVEDLALGLRERQKLRDGGTWTGGEQSLLFDKDQPQLRLVADAVAVALSDGGDEVKPEGVSRPDLRKRRNSRDFGFAIDFVRDLGIGPKGHFLAFATADRFARGREAGRRALRGSASQPVHHMMATFKLGVLGGLAVRGATAPGVTLVPTKPSPHGIAFGDSTISG